MKYGLIATEATQCICKSDESDFKRPSEENYVVSRSKQIIQK